MWCVSGLVGGELGCVDELVGGVGGPVFEWVEWRVAVGVVDEDWSGVEELGWFGGVGLVDGGGLLLVV